MQKLTKEQAEWLIGKIMNNVRTGEFSDVVYADEIEEVINECTEKEFPAIMKEWKDEEDGVHGVCLTQHNDMPCVFLDTRSTCTNFPYEEFKEFADGCNKIVEWLD